MLADQCAGNRAANVDQAQLQVGLVFPDDLVFHDLAAVLAPVPPAVEEVVRDGVPDRDRDQRRREVRTRLAVELEVTPRRHHGCEIGSPDDRDAAGQRCLDELLHVTLGDAAQIAHGELAMLAKLRGQGLQPLLPPADPSLSQPVSISWTGPAEGAVKEICLQLGYRYQEAGKPSAQILTVVVRGLNRPAHVLLEDIAWQVQPQAVLRVDPIGRVITLARTVSTGGQS